MENVDIEIGTPVIMTLVFLLLKCVSVIDWEWVWIFSPLYVFVGLILIAFAVFGVSNLFSYISASFHGRSGGGGVA